MDSDEQRSFLSECQQPNIVRYISAQGFGGEHLEIFTELKEGNIHDLIQKDLFIRDNDSATSLLHHMLQALDYLAFKGLVHRDIKPANIPYAPLPTGGYTFQLTDFGLCNAITGAQSCVGSPIFMAPDVLCNSGVSQTSMIDVWSLFVTLAYALNMDGFRGKPLNTNELKVRAVQEAANTCHPIRDMATVDPTRRASAAEMLDKLFNGEGRSTPRNQKLKSAPGEDKGATAPQKERKRGIAERVAQKGHGQALNSLVTAEKRGMPGAFPDDIAAALGGVRGRPKFT